MKNGETMPKPESRVDYEAGSPSGILVTYPMWYGHINYTFFYQNNQWYYEKATHEFGIAGRFQGELA